MSEDLFETLSATNEPIVMESLCMQCEEQGKTTLLLTKIPFFKEMILMSFYCENCGFKNSEVQSGGRLSDAGGVKISFKVENSEDFSRDIVISEYGTFKIAEIDLEFPPGKGKISTIEGLSSGAYDDLQNMIATSSQKIEPESLSKLSSFLMKLNSILQGDSFPFTVLVDDPAGNSTIKNPLFPASDPKLKIEHYKRTEAQLKTMGFNNPEVDAQEEEQKLDAEEYKHEKMQTSNQIDLNEEAAVFKVPCDSCRQEGETKMCRVTIPYESELLIMSFNCSNCGNKNSEVKSSGPVPALAKKITLKVKTKEDLNRECYKSDHARLLIPELELELDYGTLGAIYSTIEGIMMQIREFFEKNNPFVGDSVDTEFRNKVSAFFEKLDAYVRLDGEFTLIIDDPMAKSFIQNYVAPNIDPQLVLTL